MCGEESRECVAEEPCVKLHVGRKSRRQDPRLCGVGARLSRRTSLGVDNE
jgi:hypothetical protein